MAKAGMRRPDPSDAHGTESNRRQKQPKNEQSPPEELQGRQKSGKERVKPL